MMEEPLLDSSQKGGFRAITFIVASGMLTSLATNGITPNMILYLMREYHLEMAAGSNIIFFWTAATCSMPIVAAVIADSFTGRFWIVGCGTIVTFLVIPVYLRIKILPIYHYSGFCFIQPLTINAAASLSSIWDVERVLIHLGMIGLWLTSMIPQARPSPCNEFNGICSSATIFQLFLLCTSLGLISIGSGGLASSLPFGADQFKLRDGKENIGGIKRYINWYFAATTFSVFLAFGFIVYIQENIGWKVGFGIPAVLLFFSVLSFFLPSSLYVKLKAKSSLVTELIQVIVAAYKKRKIELSSSPYYSYHHKEGSTMVLPSEKLRFLNGACIILNPQQELNPDGKASDPWTLCTVDQVEDLKSVIRVIPLLFIGMLMSLSMAQGSMTTLQAKSMDRKIGSSFEIPAGSFSMFGTLSMAIWVPIYDYIVLPIASRIKGKPVNLGMKLRMGIAIFLASVSLMVKAITETARRNCAINEVDLDDSEAIVNMSAMWLIPQLVLVGFSQSLSATAQYQFFYLELPRSMASISSNLFVVEYAIANLLSSFIMTTIDDLTKRGGNYSWISSNINRGHYDYYYWVTAAICMVDVVIFLIWSKAYGPCKGETREINEEQDRLIQ